MSNSYITSNASLMAALLEHAGHLSEEFAQKRRENTNFPSCLRFVVHKFFTSCPNDTFIDDITASALQHQKAITSPGVAMRAIPTIPTPKWVRTIKNHPQQNHRYAQMVETIHSRWEHWSPEDPIARAIKHSIDELL